MIVQGCFGLMWLQTASGQSEELLVATAVINRTLVGNFIAKKQYLVKACHIVGLWMPEASTFHARITQALRMLGAHT